MEGRAWYIFHLNDISVNLKQSKTKAVDERQRKALWQTVHFYYHICALLASYVVQVDCTIQFDLHTTLWPVTLNCVYLIKTCVSLYIPDSSPSSSSSHPIK